MFFILRKYIKSGVYEKELVFWKEKNPIDSRDESKKMKTGNQPSSASSNYSQIYRNH